MKQSKIFGRWRPATTVVVKPCESSKGRITTTAAACFKYFRKWNKSPFKIVHNSKIVGSVPISYWAFFPRNQFNGLCKQIYFLFFHFLFWKSIIFVSFLLYLKTIYICFPSFILLLQCLSRQGASLRQPFQTFLSFWPFPLSWNLVQFCIHFGPICPAAQHAIWAVYELAIIAALVE